MMRLSPRWLLISMLALALAQPLSAGEKALPADLALVPADSVAFIHVRVGDLWKGDFLKPWRDTLNTAGAKALEAFDSRFFPAPSSLDRVTVVVGDLTGRPPIIIIATSKAIDKASFLKYTLPGTSQTKGAFGIIYNDARKNISVHFADDKTMVVGPGSEAMESFLTAPKVKGAGNLTESIKLANSGKSAVLALNNEAIPPLLVGLMLGDAPPPMKAMLQPILKTKTATITADLRGEGTIDLQLAFANAQQTADADVAIKDAIKLARTFIDKGRADMNKKVRGKGTIEDLPETAASLFGLGALNRLDEYLAGGPVKKNGNSLQASFKIPQGGSTVLAVGAVAAGLLVPATQKVRESAARVQSTNNLKQMALAMHNYHDVYKSFPAAAICDKDGKPLLSWRVAILPYIDELPLYQEFKLDEPWDSAHNKKLIARMPMVYMAPAGPVTTAPGQTYYRVFVGGGAAFDLKRGVKLTEITDGTSNTIMCIESSQSVTWTKPEELVYDAKKPLPKRADFYGNGVFMVAFCDGSVRAIARNVSDQTLRALITMAGGEVIGPDFDD